MMRLSICTRGVALLPFLFLSFTTQAVHYVGVPNACEQALRHFDNGFKKVEPLKETVEWSSIVESMQAAGYPEHIVKKKLRTIEWDPKKAMNTIRLYNRADWKWGEELNRKFYQNLAKAYVVAGSDAFLEKEYYNADAVIETLPYWHSIKDFDAAEFVYAYLHSKDKDGLQVGEDEIKSLLYYTPIWLEGPHALINAKRFYKSLGQQGSIHLVANHLTRRNRAQFMKYVRKQLNKDFFEAVDDYEDDAEKDMRFTAILPWRSMPTAVRDYLNEQWVDLKAYPAIRMDSVHIIANGYQDAGNCEMMTNGHMNSLGLHLDKGCPTNAIGREEWKESVLIRVNGVLVGSLKLVGDPSMLALRNVMDENGHLVLAMGGVYHIEKDVYNEIAYMQRNRNGRWRSINVSSLGVHPHSYMLNDNAWTDTNKYQMIRVLGEKVSREDLYTIIRDLIQSEDNFLDKEKNQEAVKHQTLKVIDQIRQELD